MQIGIYLSIFLVYLEWLTATGYAAYQYVQATFNTIVQVCVFEFLCGLCVCFCVVYVCVFVWYVRVCVFFVWFVFD